MALLYVSGGKVITFNGGVCAQPTSSPMLYTKFIGPNGDDTLGAGTLASPWSLSALQNNASTIVSNGNVGILPGTYQYIKNNGTQQSIYSVAQANIGTNNPVININALGTSGPGIVDVGTCDNTGHYLAQTAIIDASDPSTSATFTGYITGSSPGTVITSTNTCTLTVVTVTGTPFNLAGQFLAGLTSQGFYPVWVYGQLTGTSGGVGTYSCGPIVQNIGSVGSPATFTLINPPSAATDIISFNETNESPPQTGFIRWRGTVMRHCGGTNLRFDRVVGIQQVDCEFGPGAYVETSNPAGTHYDFANNCSVTNCLFHDLTSLPPIQVLLTAVPSGTVSSLTMKQPWPFQTSPGPGGTTYALVLGGSGQAISQTVATFTQGSATIALSPSVTITGSPTANATVQICAAAPYGGWSWINIPSGQFQPMTFTNNSVMRCGDWGKKDYPNCSIQASYNYIEIGYLGNAPLWLQTGLTVGNGSMQLQGGGVGQTDNIHHNIMCGGITRTNPTGINGIQTTGIWNFYNNSIVNGATSGLNNSIIQTFVLSAAPSGASYTGGTFTTNWTTTNGLGCGPYTMILSTGQTLTVSMGTGDSNALSNVFSCSATAIIGTPTTAVSVVQGQGTLNHYNNVYYFPQGVSGFVNGTSIGVDWFDANLTNLTSAPANGSTFTGGTLLSPFLGTSGSYSIILYNSTIVSLQQIVTGCSFTQNSTTFTCSGQTVLGTPGTGIMVEANPYWGFIGTWDYNGYDSRMTFVFGGTEYQYGTGTGSPKYGLISLANWQTANFNNGTIAAPPGFPGYDAHGVNLTSSPYVGGSTPGIPNPAAPFGAASGNLTTFAISSSSPAYTASTVGGPLGALDGSGNPGCSLSITNS